MKTDRELLDRYKQVISDHLQLGHTHQWKQRDLEYLIDLIDEKSKVRLSLSTMKRLFKGDFTKLPHTSTLNALVSVLNYKDWQEFRMANGAKSKDSTRRIILLSGLAGVLFIVFYALMPRFEQPAEAQLSILGDIHFSADKTVSTGVPNTVVFNYDVQHVVADSFAIQQSWNKAERMPLDPQENFYSRTYYYPGYHRAKLIANDSILVRLPIHITTDGWEPIIRVDFYESLPIYPVGEFVHDDILQVTKADLVQNNITDHDIALTYFNIRDFEDLSSDNFYLAIRMKNDSLKNYTCPEMRFTVHTEKNIFYTPFTIKGCEGDMSARYGETLHSGHNSDMSPFGGDVYQWQEFELTVVDKEVFLKRNGVEVFTSAFKEDFGKVKGLTCSFDGLGSVDYVRLGKSAEELVYEDDFDNIDNKSHE